MSAPVASAQRYTQTHPCPICQGWNNQRRGRGERCWGYLLADGTAAVCVRRPSDRELDSGGWLHPLPSVAPRARAPAEQVYDYRDAKGRLVHQTVRTYPKRFSQRHPDTDGHWVWNLRGVETVLYRLPELLAADLSAWVFVPEGEKDVDRLRALGLVATCNPMGAGKWKPVYSEPFRDRCVALLEDNDAEGRKHVGLVGTALNSIARRVVVVGFRELAEHADVSDWLDAGHDAADLLGRVADVADVAHPADERETLPAADVLDQVHAFLGRFVAYPSPHAHTAHTLWVAHTHLMDAWESTPRLAFLSPEPASGKTRALEVSELLVPRPVEAINVTPAYLFRKVGDSAGRPTILFDEIDTVFGPKAKDNEEIRGLLNAGHRRGAVAGRCVVRGKVVETEEIPAFCSVALAGLGDLPDTILSRSVIVRMRRRAPGERVESYRRRMYAPAGHVLRQQLATWATRVTRQAAELVPEMPEGIADREADVWEALIAVADLARGDWPARARVAAMALVADSRESTPSLGIRLLEDLRTVFADAEQKSTSELLTALCAIDEAPWGDIRGKSLDARGLAWRLRRYGVTSTNIRLQDGRVSKGYRREGLWDAWQRYLSLSSPGSATSATSATDSESEEDVHVLGANDALPW